MQFQTFLLCLRRIGYEFPREIRLKIFQLTVFLPPLVALPKMRLEYTLIDPITVVAFCTPIIRAKHVLKVYLKAEQSEKILRVENMIYRASGITSLNIRNRSILTFDSLGFYTFERMKPWGLLPHVVAIEITYRALEIRRSERRLVWRCQTDWVKESITSTPTGQ